jgi:hypothetical protein
MYGNFPTIPTPEHANPLEDSSEIYERYKNAEAAHELKHSDGWGYRYGKNRLQDEDDSDREYDRHNDA